MQFPELPKGVIFDLGDVLFTWSSQKSTTIPSLDLRTALNSGPWHIYEHGLIDQNECYRRLAQEISRPPSEIADAFDQARKTLIPNKTMMTFIRELKRLYHGNLNIYAMSNISKEDYAYLATSFGMSEMSLFDQVFTSGHVGMRKPDIGFFNHVLHETRLQSKDVVFVDDQAENIIAAESQGIRSVKFDDSLQAVKTLRNIFDCPVSRGLQYLHLHANNYTSITNTGVSITENFAPLWILEITGNREFVGLEWGGRRTWNYFVGEGVLVRESERNFPDDLDTTCMALMVLRPSHELVMSMLDEIHNYVQEDGNIVLWYNAPNKIRMDIVTTGNILAAFYSFGRGHELASTLSLVHDFILHRRYAEGTHYWKSPDVCLYFLGRLLRASDDATLQSTLGSLLLERTTERVGMPGDALDLASRIVSCDALGIDCDIDRAKLAGLQDDDGSWQPGCMYTYGRNKVEIGSRGITTTLAVQALAFGQKQKIKQNGIVRETNGVGPRK